MNELQSAAAHYAVNTPWNIFPLTPGDKIPLKGFKWRDEATNDTATIANWWDTLPTANIGIATGKPSGVYVVDIDVDDTCGKNGFPSIEELGEIPRTWICITQRGGWHLYFTSEEDIGNAAHILKDVDIRATGGYVLLPPSVGPRGKYEWHPEFNPWTVDIQPWPAWMPKKRSEKPKPAPTLFHSTASVGDPDFMRRAVAYFEKVDPAIEGQGGHNKLFWAADCAVNGLCMSDSQAIAFLWEHYNPRCIDPWEYGNPAQRNEFERKVPQARANPSNKFPYGWILNDPDFVSLPPEADVDFDALMDAGKTAEPEPGFEHQAAYSTEPAAYHEPAPVEPDKELEFLCQPHGLIGDICAYINSRALYAQPWLAVGAALSLAGTIFGRKVRDARGTRTNIYTLGMGPSSCGKSGALDGVHAILERTGYFDNLGGDDVTSPAAIETQIYNEPSTLFLWDEMGHMLKGTKGGNEHKAGIIPYMMQLYSNASKTIKGKGYADSEKQKVIVQPCVSFYGTSTPERLKEGISVEELVDGWIARVLTFTADPTPTYVGNDASDPPQHILDVIHSWKLRDVHKTELGDPIINAMNTPANASGKDELPNPVEYIATREAEAEYHALREFSRGATGHYPELWHKSEELARRVGLIMAAGRSPDVSTIEWIDAHYACRVVRYCINSFIRCVAPEVGNDRAFKNLIKTKNFVARAGIAGIQHSKLSNNCSAWFREFKGVVQALLDQEVIIARKVGRSNWYWMKEFEAEVDRCTKK